MTITGSVLMAWYFAAAFLQLGSTPVWVPLTIILIIILIFWWGLTRNQIQDENGSEVDELEDGDHARTEVEDPVEYEPIEHVEDDTTPAEIESKITVEPDDLKRIEGIGPKISDVLAEAGILTFTQLADRNSADLEKIVREDAGLKLADPSSWPEQARLAADGKWDELEQLQDDLHAGRRK